MLMEPPDSRMSINRFLEILAEWADRVRQVAFVNGTDAKHPVPPPFFLPPCPAEIVIPKQPPIGDDAAYAALEGGG